MSWKDESLKEYIKKTQEAVSYAHCLHRIKPTIMNNITSKEDLKKLDAQLYGQYKNLLPKDAPGSAFRRLSSNKFWENVLSECTAKEQLAKTNTISKNFQESALDLLDEAREVSVSNIKKRLRNTTNEPSTSTSVKNTGIFNNEHTIQDIDNPFLDHTPAERVRSQILKYRSESDRVSEIHKQDLLYYGIIDLVPSSSTKLRVIIKEAYLNEIIDMAKKIDSSGRVARDPDGGTYKDAKNFASEVLGPANNQSEIQAAIKKARKAIRERKDETYKWKKKAIKLMKLIRDVYSSDGYCSLYNKQGELHFIATFLASLLKELFKSHSCQFSLQWGDQALQIDKEDKQRNQKDDERRTPGKIPDAILSLKDYDLPFSLVEVSGPPNQLNHQHYVGDRIKLAKHLKASLKKIRRTIKSGDEDLYEDIKLFGIQVYLNKVYVYRLYQVTRGIYIFDTALSFDLACSAGLISSFMPKLVKILWKVKTLVADSARSVDDYLNSDHGNDSSDDSFDSRDTINISPKKQKMK